MYISIRIMIPTSGLKPFNSSILLWDIGNDEEPDQTPHKSESDQLLHCLLTEPSGSDCKVLDSV